MREETLVFRVGLLQWVRHGGLAEGASEVRGQEEQGLEGRGGEWVVGEEVGVQEEVLLLV